MIPLFVYDVRLCPVEDNEQFVFTLTDFFRHLSGSNQIIFETVNMAKTGGDYTVRVTTPFADSLDAKNDDRYVAGSRQIMESLLRQPMVVTLVGEDATYRDVVTADEPGSPLVLMADPLLNDLSPLCRGREHVPWYLLPALPEELWEQAKNWHSDYNAFDRLFYSTGVGEMTAHKMLCQISSPLSQKGLALRDCLEKEWNRPIFYYLYRFYGRQPKTCPVCHRPWRQSEEAAFDYQCDTCRLVADMTPDE